MAQAIISTNQPHSLKVELDVSTNAYPNSLPTATKPTSTGQTAVLYESGTNNPSAPSLLKIVPYSAANNTSSPTLRVIGWTAYMQTAGASAGTNIWVPTLLADLTLAYNATSGSIPSVDIDGSGVVRYFFSSITVATGVPTVNLYSPGTAAAAGTPPAHAIIDTVGAQLVTVQVKNNSTHTMGALWYTI